MTYAELQALQDKLPELHKLFCVLTGENHPWDCRKQSYWERWAARFKEDDLRSVVAFIQSREWPREWIKSALGFTPLIVDLHKFADRLAEAHSANKAHWATKRQPKMDVGRSAVLRASGRPDEFEPPEARPARAVLSDLFAKMKAAVDAPPETLL